MLPWEPWIFRVLKLTVPGEQGDPGTLGAAQVAGVTDVDAGPGGAELASAEHPGDVVVGRAEGEQLRTGHDAVLLPAQQVLQVGMSEVEMTGHLPDAGTRDRGKPCRSRRSLWMARAGPRKYDGRGGPHDSTPPVCTTTTEVGTSALRGTPRHIYPV